VKSGGTYSFDQFESATIYLDFLDAYDD
jgi:hypothetical protein